MKMTDVTTRLTWRQLRLLDWLRDPQHDSLPQHEAIQWRAAMWKVSDLVRLSGVHQNYTYGRCRRDLEALRAQHYVGTIIPGYWTLTEDWVYYGVPKNADDAGAASG